MIQPPVRAAADTLESALPSARQVFQSDYFTVLVEERLRIVVTVRSTKPIGGIADLPGVFGELGAALDRIGRARYAMLADVRAGPGRNDPAFDAAFLRQMPRWVGGYRRVGVLVRTAAGMLQIQRHSKQDGIERWPCMDPVELVKYLTQD